VRAQLVANLHSFCIICARRFACERVEDRMHIGLVEHIAQADIERSSTFGLPSAIMTADLASPPGKPTCVASPPAFSSYAWLLSFIFLK